jgi:hypothetical protein
VLACASGVLEILVFKVLEQVQLRASRHLCMTLRPAASHLLTSCQSIVYLNCFGSLRLTTSVPSWSWTRIHLQDLGEARGQNVREPDLGSRNAGHFAPLG